MAVWTGSSRRITPSKNASLLLSLVIFQAFSQRSRRTQVESFRAPQASDFEMKLPCSDALAGTGAPSATCATKSRPWVLAATILGSSMAFIDSTIVNVALPALQSSLHATVVDVQWVIESYGLFLSALILVGGALGDSL